MYASVKAGERGEAQSLHRLSQLDHTNVGLGFNGRLYVDLYRGFSSATDEEKKRFKGSPVKARAHKEWARFDCRFLQRDGESKERSVYLWECCHEVFRFGRNRQECMPICHWYRKTCRCESRVPRKLGGGRERHCSRTMRQRLSLSVGR